ncbi:peroxidase family protein [Methylobacterium sp. J-090]|uniref:peroxidase family protein n=1 Tax=Methylobacterium sp. J-090 TaxID=2836666 RepID=UPI001FB9AEA7|nr:peroxidase family protein [Methylobacterium sp. J-090]MCJ2082283.1 peroxidase [Methylobacterium sp. J-090]
MEFYSITGSGNNLNQADLNAAGSTFARLGAAHYADGISTLVDGPNARSISNIVVGEGDPTIPNPQGLSGMLYAWGQFVDHDLDLSRTDGVTRIDVVVPAGDAFFAAGSPIPITRAVIDPATGAGTDRPAIAQNAVTGWLDASMVYGSDAATAAHLRLPDGHLATSAGDNLPIVKGAFLAGDGRAAENPSLTALQTLFLREHNLQVDQLHAAHPDLGGDALYHQARAIVTAEIQHITYDEFLPHLLGAHAIAPYEGYDAEVDPRISVEFAGAAYRFGHSIVSAETERVDETGNLVGPGLKLRDTFGLTPAAFAAASGADGFLRHLGDDASQTMDVRIVEDLRNFLNDPPVVLDLASINIQRGRDLGLGTLNETREELGFAPYKDFSEITDDQATVAAMREAFGSVEAVDLWTGGLAEGHAPHSLLGPTFSAIVGSQFDRLRDGDRLWYENDQFDRQTLNDIRQTTLSDIITRNTDTRHIQDDAFTFYDRRSSDVASENPNAPQLVIGTNGEALVVGGPKGDMLVAGTGEQTLTGGGGNDQFVFTADTTAVITDFRPGRDHLVFETAGGGTDSGHEPAASGRHHDTHDGPVVTWDHGHAVITYGSVEVELLGVRPAQISANEYTLA